MENERVKSRRGTTLVSEIVAIVVVLVFALVVALTFFVKGNPIKRFEQALEARSADEVQKQYIVLSHDPKYAAQAQAIVDELVKKNEEDYALGAIMYADAQHTLGLVTPAYDITQAIGSLYKIMLSKLEYEKAESALAAGDYFAAIDSYKKVIRADTQYYSSAEQAIINIRDTICELALKKAADYSERGDYYGAVSALLELYDAGYANRAVADALDEAKRAWSARVRARAIEIAAEMTESGNYFGAFNMLNNVPHEHRDEDITARLAAAKSKATAVADTTVREMMSSGDYFGALDYLRDIPDALENTDFTTLLVSLYHICETAVFAEAEEQAKAGDYDAAIATLTAAKQMLYVLPIDDDVARYEEQKNISVLKNAKSAVDIDYDSEYERFEIRPKGLSFEYININSTRSIDPTILVYDDGDVFFWLYLGFGGGKAVVLDEINIDCDGRVFTYEFEHAETQEDISDSSWVYESFFIVHSNFPSDEQSHLQNLRSLMAKFRTAENFKVRFSGTGGERTVTLPAEHIGQTLAMWDIYEILYKDSALISYLK